MNKKTEESATLGAVLVRDMASKLVKHQEKEFVRVMGKRAIVAHVCYDDQCGNGHNTFAITGTTYSTDRVNGESSRDFGGVKMWVKGGGRIHDEIAKAFPPLAPLLKWHLCSSDGPLHYVSNVVYFACDRDHNGLRKGESRQLRDRKTGLPSWELAVVNEAGEPVKSPEKYMDAESAPACSLRLAYVPWCHVGEGKDRQFDAARVAAIWPDATDAELSVEPAELERVLLARLPALMVEFRAAVESLGFEW